MEKYCVIDIIFVLLHGGFRDLPLKTDRLYAQVAHNMRERSEHDYLIYNTPLEYADLILNGDPETYLKTVTEYKPLD